MFQKPNGRFQVLGPLAVDDVFDPVDGAIKWPRNVVMKQLGYSSILKLLNEINKKWKNISDDLKLNSWQHEILSYEIPVFFQGNYPLKTNRQEIPVFWKKGISFHSFPWINPLNKHGNNPFKTSFISNICSGAIGEEQAH